MLFYLLSLVTGVLECGWIAYGAVHALPLWRILCYPLAYHIGNLFPKPFSLSKPWLTGMAALSAAAAVILSVGSLSNNVEFLLTCVSLMCLSAVIQSVRSVMKSEGNRLAKRVFRVGGFALAPLAAVVPSAILFVSVLVALYALRDYKGRCEVNGMNSQSGYSAVMVFHQFHYFFYAHITLAAMSLMLVRRFSAVGALAGALLFCGTWLTYMSVEPIVSKLTARVLSVFYVGHIGISLLLFVMSFVTAKPLFILLWLVTGFGGGVVYTISARAKVKSCYDATSMTISENIGHTLGLMSATAVAVIFPTQSPQIMLVFGSASAILAVIVMSVVSRKENNHEIIRHHG